MCRIRGSGWRGGGGNGWGWHSCAADGDGLCGWSYGHSECGGGCAGSGCGCAGCGGWGGGAWVLGLRLVFEMVWGCVTLDLALVTLVGAYIGIRCWRGNCVNVLVNNYLLVNMIYMSYIC